VRGYAAPQVGLHRPLRDIRLEEDRTPLDTSRQEEQSLFESIELSKRAQAAISEALSES